MNDTITTFDIVDGKVAIFHNCSRVFDKTFSLHQIGSVQAIAEPTAPY